MSERWMRVSEAAAAMSVSESTVRRRVTEGQLRGRTGASGLQEVFVESPRAGTGTGAQAHATGLADRVRAVASSTPIPTPPSTRLSTSTRDAESSDDLLKRYERMAGGSLVLAQQRADELTQAATAAYENLAHARSQLRQLRKVALAGWATTAVVLLVGFVLVLASGVSRANAQARHQAHEQAIESATARMTQLQNQLAGARDANSPYGVSQALADSD